MPAEAFSLASIGWDYIVGGLALFLFGIQFMGDGLKNFAGDKLKSYIDRYTNKTWKGILVGTIITVFIQSSSATSSIAIGFVRAGLMKLDQSIGIIIGANIGTTITAFLIGLKIEEYALYFIFVGVLITLFANRKKHKYLGEILLGFGILFFGLRLMGDELSKTGQLDFFENMATAMGNQPLLGFIGGTVLTAIVQSSSATVGIIQKIYDSGALTLYASLPFIFGAAIGTTITAVFASIGGSASARRAAYINVGFNTAGALLFLLFLNPYAHLIEYLSVQFHLAPMMQIAIAHIIRAITISLLAYPFIKWMVALSRKLIKSDHSEQIELDFTGLDPTLAATLPAAALEASAKATIKMGELAIDEIKETQKFFNTKSGKYRASAAQLEDAVNTLDIKITEYLTSISHNTVSPDDIDAFLGNIQVVKNLERIGDIAMNLNEFYDMVYDDKGLFTEQAMQDVNEMYELIIRMMDFSIGYFMEPDESLRMVMSEKEDELDLLFEKAKRRHFARMSKNECSDPIASSIYVDILSNLERMGDHTHNIIKLLHDPTPHHELKAEA